MTKHHHLLNYHLNVIERFFVNLNNDLDLLLIITTQYVIFTLVIRLPAL